jgi:hemerythrin-like domain-containing protein
VRKLKELDMIFIDLFTYFFTAYIDIYLHGKEENIMFERLKKKEAILSMQELRMNPFFQKQ